MMFFGFLQEIPLHDQVRNHLSAKERCCRDRNWRHSKRNLLLKLMFFFPGIWKERKWANQKKERKHPLSKKKRTSRNKKFTVPPLCGGEHSLQDLCRRPVSNIRESVFTAGDNNLNANTQAQRQLGSALRDTRQLKPGFCIMHCQITLPTMARIAFIITSLSSHRAIYSIYLPPFTNAAFRPSRARSL